MKSDLIKVVQSKDLSNYTSMLYAPAKFGKTTFAVNMFGQKGLILAWEIGYKGIKGAMAVPMRRWSDCSKLTRQLKDEKVKDKFNVLIIDTMDLMYEAALAQILAINNVDSINKIGFGQGYTQLDNLIKNQLLEWQRLGYSIFVISHSINREEEVMMADGTIETIEKYVPTLNKRCFNLVNKFVDNIFFGNILIDNEGKEQRTLFTRETINYKAGSRFKYLPDRLPLDSDKVNEAIEEALRKEDDSEIEKIIELEDEYGTDKLKLAIKECCLNNVKKIAYLNGILKNWKDKTLDEIKSEKLSENQRELNYTQQDLEIAEYDWVNEDED